MHCNLCSCSFISAVRSQFTPSLPWALQKSLNHNQIPCQKRTWTLAYEVYVNDLLAIDWDAAALSGLSNTRPDHEGVTGWEQQGVTGGWWDPTVDDDCVFSLSDGFKSGTVKHVLWGAGGEPALSLQPSTTPGDLTDEFRRLPGWRWANQRGPPPCRAAPCRAALCCAVGVTTPPVPLWQLPVCYSCSHAHSSQKAFITAILSIRLSNSCEEDKFCLSTGGTKTKWINK